MGALNLWTTPKRGIVVRVRTRESRRRKRNQARASRDQQTFRSRLFETLEDRRLLTTVGMTTLEQLQHQEVERAFERVSDLDQYPSYVISEAREWAVQVAPGTNVNSLKADLGVASLRPSGVIPNTYLFTLPEAVMPSPPVNESSSTEEAGDNSGDDDGGLDENPDADLHAPVIMGTSTVDSATSSSLVVDGIQYGFAADPVATLTNRPGVQHFYPLVNQDVSFSAGERFRPDDEFFPDQWYLYNDGANSLGGTPGEDIRVEAVWNEPFGFTGNGITVGVVDSGVQMDHEDLVRNLEPTLACDFSVVAGNAGTILCDMTDPDDIVGHGTSVAGIIAAEANNNGTGVAGIAFNAKLAAMKLGDGALTDEIISEAFSRFRTDVDIYNNSWGQITPAWLSQPGPLTLAAMQQTVAGVGGTAGRNGLGGIIVFSAGNDGSVDDDDSPTDGTADNRTDYAGLKSSRYTINVGGVGHTGERATYSDIGSSLFISAYTGDIAEDGGVYGLATTGIGDTYPTDFNGTSAAAPVVSGVLALVLEANPSLTWRDVQHVVVESARQTDVLNPSWQVNAAGHAFSEEYGFGVIDALSAVVTAQNWTNVGTEVALTAVAEIEDPIPIPDNGVPIAGSDNQSGFVRSDVEISQCVNIESVEIIVSAPHEDWSDLGIKLISPSGTEAVFAEKHDATLDDTQYDNWVVSTPKFWGECSAGTWSLIVDDSELHNEGTLSAFQLNVYGSETIVPPEPPPESAEGDISGTKWQDDNGDGMMNNSEQTLEGVWIYADLDGDGRIDLGEPAAITDSAGNYALNDLPSGTYTIREVMTPGWNQVYPGGDGGHVVELVSDTPVTGVDFGNQYGFDFGDAPAPYPTLQSANGASHGLIDGFHMGATVDSETEGIPSATAIGDDTNANGDDEDGVFFTDMFADTTASVQVVISNGSSSSGVLQGWIDFNADGDWSDAGEQVFLDQAVEEGSNNLTFNVPDGAQIGHTFARFRYGYERGISFTGAAFAGEVEDHRVLIMENDPVGVDDSFVVIQNSADTILDVLGNDFQGIVGGLSISAIGSMSHGGMASVQFDAGLGRDVISYTPAVGFFSPPSETFTYTLTDTAGTEDTATVLINVQPEFVDPIAIDDSFEVDGTSLTPQGYNVVINDVEGTNGELTLDSVTQPAHGTVSLAGDGKSVLYTPDGSWFNMESFTYTVSNPLGQSRTGNVTVHVAPEVLDNTVEFGITFQDDAGLPLVGNTVSVGDQFQVTVSVEDLRLAPEGVFSAYMDLLYERDHVSVVSASAVNCTNPLTGVDFGICFDGEYTSLIHGSADKPGLIDEVGGLRPIITAPGDVGPMELFVITFQAHSAGVTDFKTDPTDDLPTFETTVYGLLSAVDPPEITYGFSQLTIDGGGSAEGEGLDINGDGAVTPIDALSVINDLNENGSRAVGNGAEGETAAADARLDVNGDNFISPADALLLINHLNGKAESGEGEAGEGEGEAPVMGPLPQDDLNRVSLDSTPEQAAAALADALLATVDPARNLSSQVDDSSDQDRDHLAASEDAGSQGDQWLDDLAADVWQAWIS